MIDVKAEARAIVDRKGEAWDAAVDKLEKAWNEGDQAALEAWQAVFSNYLQLAYALDDDGDDFYDYQIYMNASHYATPGYDPRYTPNENAEDRAALEQSWDAERVEKKANPRPPVGKDVDDDIPY